jgi:tetratricopeptide (TPR) repeat protein/type II secretory pathway predicted ATPase ExeA
MVTEGQFEDHVRQALEHVNDVAWLEQNSPLATPYFLGVYLSRQPASDSPGVILHRLLIEAAASLWDGPLPQTRSLLREMALRKRDQDGVHHPCYLFYVLELRYLRRYYPSSHFPNSVKSMYGYLDTSKTRFSYHLKQAIQMVAAVVTRLVMPAGRLESPAAPIFCVGRDGVISQIQAALQQGHSVSLSGPMGIGKTTVAAAIRAIWHSQDNTMVFWYTLRPNVTDSLTGLLFALAAFFYRLDTFHLWRQLVAAPDALQDVNTALAYIEADVEGATKRPLLFCFDEIDLLGSPYERLPSQRALLELITGLSHLVPCLLIGQLSLIDTPHHYQLPGLSLDDADALAQARAITLPERKMRVLLEWSEGNARVLGMIFTLIQEGATVDDLADLTAKAPSLHAILERIWKRLRPQEQLLMQQMSVFRAATPRQSWHQYHASAPHLRDRQFIEEDETGGVLLRPSIRKLIYAGLNSLERETYHERAAWLRVSLSEYTAAAYHFVQAGLFEEAVNSWFEHRHMEVNQGKAKEAFAIFSAIPTRRLEGNVKQRLHLINDQLALLMGANQKIIASPTPADWSNSLLKVEAWLNRAEASRNLGQEDNALSQYQHAIDSLSHLTRQFTRIRYLMARLQVRTGDLDNARQQMEYARYDATHLRGFVYAHQGDLDAAQEAFLEALTIAQALPYEQGIALTARELAHNAGQRRAGEEAQRYLEMAMSYYHRIGDRYNLECVRVELAGILKETKAYQQAISIGEEALLYFRHTKSPDWVATIQNILAEAFLETGDLAHAREYALAVYQSEIPYLQPYAIYTLGCIEVREGNGRQAETIWQEGVKIACYTGDNYILAYLYHQLSLFYKEREDEQQKSLYCQRARELLPDTGYFNT